MEEQCTLRQAEAITYLMKQFGEVEEGFDYVCELNKKQAGFILKKTYEGDNLCLKILRKQIVSSSQTK